jgi:hypothetical protein
MKRKCRAQHNMKNTVQQYKHSTKNTIRPLINHESNRHFYDELYRSLKHTCKITHNIHKIPRYTCGMFILWTFEREIPRS